MTDSGLILNPKYPYLAAIHDSNVCCSCHGKGCVKVKCPLKCNRHDINTLSEEDREFCLQTLPDGRLQLKRKHH